MHILLKFLFFFIIHTGFVVNALAQTNYKAIDSRVTSIKSGSVENLHSELVKGLTTDEEKVRAFYVWIANNINYDVNEASRSYRAVVKQEPDVVFNSRRAVCHGYSALFQKLCELSNIKCYLVSGFAKLYGVFDETGHTWNMVYVNERWNPIDVTWGAGGVNQQRRFVKKFSEQYFFASPADFLSEHFPFDPMWQLMEHPVSLSEYKKKDVVISDITSKTIFNYSDTIAEWERMDRTSRALSSARRMDRFNPGNKIIKQELAFALLESGNNEFEKGNRILAELYPKSTGDRKKQQSYKPGTDSFKNKLSEAELYFINSGNYYNQVKLTDPGENQVLQNNKKALKNNLDVIRRELAAYK